MGTKSPQNPDPAPGGLLAAEERDVAEGAKRNGNGDGRRSTQLVLLSQDPAAPLTTLTM